MVLLRHKIQRLVLSDLNTPHSRSTSNFMKSKFLQEGMSAASLAEVSLELKPGFWTLVHQLFHD